MTYQLLRSGQTVHIDSTSASCTVGQFLGGGGQGEVYSAAVDGQTFALKWYFPDYLAIDLRLRDRLDLAIKRGAPNEKFLWPMALASMPGDPTFGYIMALREPRFKSTIDLMKRRVEPSFRALATAGFELAHSYLQLHAKGLCYYDISFGNVFFDPAGGDIRVCDNDNVDVNGVPGSIAGTMGFMAPEVVRGEALPNTQTDLFSLAVLLFYMLMVEHPLHGKREAAIEALDANAKGILYGTEPIFIFDPDDERNRPVVGIHDNALAFWPIYPQFLRELFIRTFTVGLRDPGARAVEAEWRAAMVRLRDSIIYCNSCGAENFYDRDALRAANGAEVRCWACGRPVQLPPRIRLDKVIIMLNHDTELYPHHVDSTRRYDFSRPMAQVIRHPTTGDWGLKNLSDAPWTAIRADGQPREVPPGRSIGLSVGTKINFGRCQGEIRL